MSVKQPSSRRATAGAGLASFVLVMACGEVTLEPAAQMRIELGTCGATPLTSDEYRFPSIGKSVRLRACQNGNGLVVEATDASLGKALDFEQLRQADAVAFKAYSGATVDDRVNKDATTVEADVWLRVDLSDAPRKEVLAASVPDRNTWEATMRARVAAAKANIRQHSLLSDASVARGSPASDWLPVIRVKGSMTEIEALGKLPEVWQVRIADRAEYGATATAEEYFTTTQQSVLDAFAIDGTGRTVAILEAPLPDSTYNLSGLPAGSCVPGYGPYNYKCHCNDNKRTPHPRQTGSVVRNSAVSFGGMADEASRIFANHSTYCTTHGPDPVASAIGWATASGASVINQSEWMGADGTPQNARDLLFDWTAATIPWPTMVTTVGNYIPTDPNQNDYRASGNLRNGLSIGGAVEDPVDPTNRDLVTWDPTAARINYLGSGGMEMPHLSAISQNVRVSGFLPASTELFGGTSAAAPEVAAVVAALQENNSALVNWPEATIAGLMASADDDTDGTWLNLHDMVDDSDGAGLVNAYLAGVALTPWAKFDGGNTPAATGHDYGTIDSTTTPVQSYYGETWNATVAPGEVLRVALVMFSQPACPSTPGWSVSPCSGNDAPFPKVALVVWDGSTIVRMSFSVSNNYQYATWQNTTQSTKTYSINYMVYNWSGLGSTTWGIAWASGTYN